MAKIPADVITKLADAQTQVWQSVSMTVSESANQLVNFITPVTESVKTSDLYGALNEPMMVIQFAFANQQDNPQVVLLLSDTIADLYELINGKAPEELDESVVGELRPQMEAVVQGLCLAIGNLKNETIVASGLSIRFQSFAFPVNLQNVDEIARVSLKLEGGGEGSDIYWLMDTETLHHVMGISLVETESAMPFEQLSSPAASAAPASGIGGGFAAPPKAFNPSMDSNGLDILMDVPLEISVELGRVKMLVKEVVELGSGSIVEIDKAAGEPVDVMVNGRLVARGEVVVIEDNFGVRITEILNPHGQFGRMGDAA